MINHTHVIKMIIEMTQVQVHYHFTISFILIILKFNIVPENKSFKKIMSVVIGTIIPLVFCMIYIGECINIYRKSDNIMKGLIALFFHPLLCEIILFFLSLQNGKGNRHHPFYDHIFTLTMSPTLNLFRRFLFSNSGIYIFNIYIYVYLYNIIGIIS